MIHAFVKGAGKSKPCEIGKEFIDRKSAWDSVAGGKHDIIPTVL